MKAYDEKAQTSIKGRLGEQICVQRWVKQGYLVYGMLNGYSCPHCGHSPYGPARRHFFDYFLMRPMAEGYSPPVGQPDKVPLESMRFIEVKTKKSKGGKISINRRDLDVYEQLMDVLFLSEKQGLKNLPFTVIFVDDETKSVYSQSLEKMFSPVSSGSGWFPQEVPYTEQFQGKTFENPYVWFTLSQLKKLFTLRNHQTQVLDENSSRTSLTNNANDSA